MKIAVLGAGAMGMLIGGMLSTVHDVTLVDVNPTLVEHINAKGIIITEKDGSRKTVRPHAAIDTTHAAPCDVVIVFVKAMHSKAALDNNRGLIGSDTYLLTLQNGSGHEELLQQYADDRHIVIGTTQHNSSVAGLGEINHGGSGHTVLGGIADGGIDLQPIADAFLKAGLDTSVSANVKKLIWRKLFTNVSVSALTGALQCPMGFIIQSPHAWSMCQTLVKEAVAVANGDGMDFDWQEELQTVYAVCEKGPKGYTSIYADLAAGRKTEVDTISGSVVRASQRNGIPAPSHSFLVQLIHAMEDRVQ